LRRACDSDTAHARDLGRDDVHDDAAGIDRDPAGNVETDPVNRKPALSNSAAGRHLGGHVGPALVLVNDAHSPDGLLQGGSHVSVQQLQSGSQDVCRDPEQVGSHPVEPLAKVTQSHGTAKMHLVTDRPNH